MKRHHNSRRKTHNNIYFYESFVFCYDQQSGINKYNIYISNNQNTHRLYILLFCVRAGKLLHLFRFYFLKNFTECENTENHGFQLNGKLLKIVSKKIIFNSVDLYLFSIYITTNCGDVVYALVDIQYHIQVEVCTRLYICEENVNLSFSSFQQTNVSTGINIQIVFVVLPCQHFAVASILQV